MMKNVVEEVWSDPRTISSWIVGPMFGLGTGISDVDVDVPNLAVTQQRMIAPAAPLNPLDTGAKHWLPCWTITIHESRRFPG